ncbi:hypothetical protein, partial [Vibrio vulnificus]|uniref:hypothetical protein n=1 Tax=Vibrio vulnificus TaxID=672 RepID=UPI003C12F87D
FPNFTIVTKPPNAALRGECRTNQLTADHFHHQNSPHAKNATRHESHLNALLYQFLANHKQSNL